MKRKIPNSLKKSVFLLTGDKKNMKLEHRVFNFMCIIGILIIGYNIPFSYALGLHSTAYIYCLMFIALCLSYYYARLRNQYKMAIVLCAALVMTVLTASFFLTSGIAGPSLLALTLAFFLNIIVSSKKQTWIWTSAYVATGIGLIAIQYFFPEMISTPYYSTPDLYLDLASSYTILILVIFAGLGYLKSAYYKEKESAENRAMEMERMNDEKTKFFSIISHDLRAPLASIQGYMEMLKVYEINTADRALLEQKLTIAVASTQEMLNNLLSWSKSQLNSSNVCLTAHPINSVLDTVIISQKMAAMEKNISLTHEIDNSITLMCDINMLQLVIRNLTGNAIKFTPENGAINVSATREGTTCLITVRDNGKGIDQANTPVVFSLKAESTYGTANEKGIGLGLYLCKEYTMAQHGEIWFKSELGKGSAFFVSLPLGDENNQHHPDSVTYSSNEPNLLSIQH